MLDHDIGLAKKALEHYAPCPLSSWDQGVARYRGAKKDLVTLLDPDSGKRVLAIESMPLTTPQIVDEFAKACRAIAQVDFPGFFTSEEIVNDRVRPENSLLGVKTIKAGMKLTKALMAWLATKYRYGLSPEELGKVGQKLNDRWEANNQRKGREQRPPIAEEMFQLMLDEFSAHRATDTQGTLVLSASILDLLLMSVSAPWSTCHAFRDDKHGGERQSGPQQYLYDAHTAVAYFYREERPYAPCGASLPWKLWRQLLHFDLKNKTCAFMRNYPADNGRPGTGLPDVTHQKLRDLVASLLGLESYDFVPFQDIPLSGANGFAYVDGQQGLSVLHGALVPKGGVVRKLPVCRDAPCLACFHPLDVPSYLVCNGCHQKHCCGCCQRKVDPQTAHVVPGHKNPVCHYCFVQRYKTCDVCQKVVTKDGVTQIKGQTWCNDCLCKVYRSCSNCGSLTERDKAVEREARVWCKTCHDARYGTCADCGKVIVKTPANTGKDKVTRCRDCRPKLQPVTTAASVKEVWTVPVTGVTNTLTIQVLDDGNPNQF